LCSTSTRTPIVATVNIPPSITSTSTDTRCDAGSVTLGAVASGGTINWYNVPVGGIVLATGTSFTTPNIAITTTYYIDATAAGCTTPTRTAIIATIIATPTITSTLTASRCDAGTVTLGAVASAGTINWYNVSTGGTSLGTGTSFITPSITSTTTFYVDATASLCTTASRTPIIATVNLSPSITSTIHGARCDIGVVTLGAVASSGIINWYDVPTGGTSLGTGNSFATPSLAANTSYYVEAIGPLCTNPTRTVIIATINAIPTITSTTLATRCDTGPVTLGAVASAGTINWYNVATGGTALGTGTSFTTPIITTTTTFYVDATASLCTTATRTPIIAAVNISPTITSTTPAARCDIGVVTLNAVASSGIINWYDVPTGGTSLGTGTSFTTLSLPDTTTYYVDATANGCASPRVPVVATIYPIVKINEEVILCKTETVTLDASIPGMIYLWSPGGETNQTIVISSIGDYSVTISSPLVAACDSHKYIKVIERPKPIIKTIIVNENSISIELENPENYYEYSIDERYYQDSNEFSYIPSGQHTAFVREKNICNLVQQDFTIFTITKYFTPNNDGYNDLWEIKEIKDFPNSSVLIFDRYGKYITTLNAINKSWNGTYNGSSLPADDYWYILNLGDGKPEIKGHFSLKR
jgi:gliding motility-associated-like protein